jgi:alkylation response protein AidB-like acyl-CoA dehydrogenase
MAELAVGLAQVEVDVRATLAELARGGDAVDAAARMKLRGSELVQAVARTAFDLGGPAVATTDTPFELLWRQSFMETIAGGTTEILLGIISRQALGLGMAS